LNILTFLFQQTDGATGLITSLLPFLLIILVFYFLIMRPQKKKQKARQMLLEGVKKGDKIITTGGIYGQVEGIEDSSILLKIADNVKIKLDKTAVGTIFGVTDEKK